MKQGWIEKRLIEIADVSTGKYDANHANNNGKYRFYTCANKFGMCNTKRFSGKSLILPGNGVNVGEVFYYDGEFDAYQRTYVINNIKIFPMYLYYHMLLFWKELGTKIQYGSATNFIKIGNFQNYNVSYPPLPEQKRIVAILNKCFAAIDKAKANAEQNLKNARELFESYLQSVFENKGDAWEEKVLNEICEVKDGTHDSPKYIKEGIPFVTQKNIRKDGLSFDNTKFITDSDHNKFYKRSNVSYGDILISMIGANRGMSAIVNDKRVFSIKNVGLIKENKNINKFFLLYYLKSPIAMKYVKNMSNGGAQEFVGLTSLRNFPIPYPPKEKQQIIVKKLNSLTAETQKLETIYEQKINDLEELKKSVLQKAFNGDLK